LYGKGRKEVGTLKNACYMAGRARPGKGKIPLLSRRGEERTAPGAGNSEKEVNDEGEIPEHIEEFQRLEKGTADVDLEGIHRRARAQKGDAKRGEDRENHTMAQAGELWLKKKESPRRLKDPTKQPPGGRGGRVTSICKKKTLTREQRVKNGEAICIAVPREYEASLLKKGGEMENPKIRSRIY